MTLSIDVLPAPFGPMIARISWRRIARLISLSALTPPKARLISSASSSVSPITLVVVMLGASARLAQDRRGAGERHRLRRADLEVGLEHALAAVLERHRGLDVRAVASVVERRDQRRVALADEAPPHLARPRQLAVIGIELLG